MKKLFALLCVAICFTSCTYNLTQIQTSGTASDIVDDPDTTSVNANLTANVPISGAGSATK
jgi:hypothetical protein